DVLDAFFADPEIGLSELARRVGVTKSTMHRTCGVLVARGVLERTQNGRYRLGVRLLEYGQLVTTRSVLRTQALPLLVELRNAIGETVQLGVPSGGDVLYIERVEGLGALRFTTEANRRGPVHRSSAGKAIAAFRPEVAAARIKAGMKPFTGHTIVIPQMFVAELERVRERGYAISIDESEIGLSSIGVPIRDQPDGQVIASISTAGPTGRLLGDHQSHHVRLMLNAGRQLTNALAAGAYTLPRQRRAAR
ncbi:MAG TPA: IclR family transcriptional regulator, partial [Ilumatobacteraceae bacterium]